ncbi:MAG: hypothetical protein RL688_1219, partial [Actinomycetota bacterium]
MSAEQWYEQRLVRVRDLLGQQTAVQGILLSDLNDIRWLTSFTGSSGWLLITASDMWLFTDGRYTEQAAA